MNIFKKFDNNHSTINLKGDKLKDCINESLYAKTVEDYGRNLKNSINYNPIDVNLKNSNDKKFSSTFFIDKTNNKDKFEKKKRFNSNDDYFLSNGSKTTKPFHKHDGFSLNNIPHVDASYKMSDTKYLNFSHTNFHCKKIINSLHMSNNLKVNDEMQKISKVDFRKVNKAKTPKDFIEKLCELENTKYGRIFKMQQSKEFLKERNLPQIKYEKKKYRIYK